MTDVNDIVLIYMENQPLSFARVEGIFPDHKDGWFQLKLLFLQVPLQVVTWILREEYINGTMFHMNGKEMRLEKVVCPDVDLADMAPESKNTEETTEKQTGSIQTGNKERGSETSQSSDSSSSSGSGNVVSLSDFRRKK